MAITCRTTKRDFRGTTMEKNWCYIDRCTQRRLRITLPPASRFAVVDYSGLVEVRPNKTCDFVARLWRASYTQRVTLQNCKCKGFTYSIPIVGPGADPGVQAVSRRSSGHKSSTLRQATITFRKACGWLMVHCQPQSIHHQHSSLVRVA